MPGINGSDILSDPWGTTFSPFTDLFNSAFWLIPLSFICVALYVKTRNPVGVSAFMVCSGLILSSGNMFMNHPEMSYLYMIFAAIGFIGVIIGVFFIKT